MFLITRLWLLYFAIIWLVKQTRPTKGNQLITQVRRNIAENDLD
jgi:hypothetical protein